jgi:hypothetical protein
MDEAVVKSKIDKILDFHRKGLRDIDETAANLDKLCTPLDPALRDKVFDCLFFLLVPQISQKPLPETNERVRNPSIIRVIMRTISRSGPAQLMFAQLFAHLDPDNATVTRNWGDDVFPELVNALYEQPDQFSQGMLN